ncbi:MAG: chemotaxis response regulator protein-glutamate methylesterase, partial [Beijerinckiaceae bacterium]
LHQSKIMNVIDSNKIERDAGGKPVPTFPHPALACVPEIIDRSMSAEDPMPYRAEEPLARVILVIGSRSGA